MAINAEDVMDAVQEVADGKFMKEHIKAKDNAFNTEQEVQDLINNPSEMRALLDQSYVSISNSANERFKSGWQFVNYTFGNPSGEPTIMGNPRYIFHDVSNVVMMSEYFVDRGGRYVIRHAWTILGEEK